MRFLGLFFILFISTHNVWAQAKIKVFEPEFDFGSISAHAKVKHTFKFKNEGTKKLEIQELKAYCSCTTTELSKKIYKPGETGEITVNLDPQRLDGPVVKLVEIISNDLGKHTVTLKGTVLQNYTFGPRSVFFAKARKGIRSTQEIKLTKNTLGKIAIQRVDVKDDYLTATAKRLDNKNYLITVVADGTKYPKGKSRLISALTVVFEDGTSKNLTVTVNVTKAIRLSPNGIYFFATQKGKERENRVKLLSDDVFEITKMESDLDFIEVEKINDRAILVKVKSTANPSESKFTGKVIIHTTHPTESIIEIVVRGSIVD
jgi:hypothetical protein